MKSETGDESFLLGRIAFNQSDDSGWLVHGKQELSLTSSCAFIHLKLITHKLKCIIFK